MKNNKANRKRLRANDDALSDERFKHLKSEAKFIYSLPRKETKAVVDSRFADALKEERFQNRAKVDKYGRIVTKKSAVAEEMDEMYQLEHGSISTTKEMARKTKGLKAKARQLEEKDNERDTSGDEARLVRSEPKVESESDEEDEDDDQSFKLDLARGHAEMLSSSGDSSDSEVEDDGEGGNENEEWAELDRDARRVEWSSYRLAICNLDWDHLNSEDLFILCQSFLKNGGSVQSLTIYISDFGKERMEKEEQAGPSFMVGEDEEKDERWHQDSKKKKTNLAVRQYEIDRLRYYYAVLVCDSPETATIIYEQCDGHEFENSGMRIDMRFIPDEMEFEASRVKEKITRDQLKLETYRPKGFINKATSMSNAEITWDENNPDRVRKIKDAFEDEDLDRATHDLIASSSDEEGLKGEEGGESKKSRDERINILMQAAGLEQQEKDLEIEWEPPEAQDSDQSDMDEESEEEALSDGEGNIRKKPTQKKQKWKAYQERRRELRKERKRELRENKEIEKPPESILQIPKKSKKAKKMPTISVDDTSRVVADPRFSALFTDSAFAIEKSSKDLKDASLITKQVEARKAMRMEEDRKAKNRSIDRGGETQSEGQQLVEKLKKKTTDGMKKKYPNH